MRIFQSSNIHAYFEYFPVLLLYITFCAIGMTSKVKNGPAVVALSIAVCAIYKYISWLISRCA